MFHEEGELVSDEAWKFCREILGRRGRIRARRIGGDCAAGWCDDA
jgi:hypothetical protein